MSNEDSERTMYRARLEAATRIAQTSGDEQALEEYSRIIAIYPLESEAFFRRAQSHLALGNAPSALDDLGSAIERNPDEPANYYFRGRCRIELGEFSGGVSDLTKAIELESALGSDYYLESARLSRAIGCYLGGDTTSAARACATLRDDATTYLGRKLWSVSGLKGKLRSR